MNEMNGERADELKVRPTLDIRLEVKDGVNVPVAVGSDGVVYEITNSVSGIKIHPPLDPEDATWIYVTFGLKRHHGVWNASYRVTGDGYDG